MRRLRCIAAFAAACIIVLSGCSAPEYHYEVRKDLSVCFGNADSVIQTIREAFVSRSPRITIEYTSSGDNMDDIPALVNELVTFAMSETDHPCEGDYLYHQYGGYSLGYSHTKAADGGFAYLITLVPEYYTTAEQESEVTERVNDIVRQLGADDMTDLEKVRAVYDYIYDNVSFDLVHAKNDHYHLKTTAYAALVHRTAVCQGYSVLMYRLLRELGVDCRVITGTALGENTGEYHAWNIVGLGGTYYNVDITWDRQTETHDYFLRGEETFSADHIRDAEYSAAEFYERQYDPHSEHSLLRPMAGHP